VGLLGAYEDADWVYLMTPYMAGGDLFALLDATGSGLSPKIAKRYFGQVVSALRVLQQKLHVAHG
jgi:serine/threonine protein kinase